MILLTSAYYNWKYISHGKGADYNVENFKTVTNETDMYFVMRKKVLRNVGLT